MSKNMKKYSLSLKRLKSRQGAVAIIVGLMMAVFIGFAALAVDIGHLYVVRNELQNAADAGALAGARFLYNNNGTAVNTGANQIAYDTATANTSEKVSVDVHWTGGNNGDVQRGHWSFATRTFTPNDSTTPVDLWNVSTAELDANTNFINAIRVRTRRQDTPADSFFARIFGHENFSLSTEAIAYIGFAGELLPKDVDQPIGICKESLLIDGNYSCTIGRMINSGQQVESSETGGWTDFNQDNPCIGGTNATAVKSLVCGNGNPEPIYLGKSIATNGGEIQSAFNKLIECWKSAADSDSDNIPDTFWNLTLPVINCPGNNVGTCETVAGAVNVNILWITEAGESSCQYESTIVDPNTGATITVYNYPPLKMGEWHCSDQEITSQSDFNTCWAEFVNAFDLKNLAKNENGEIVLVPAPCQKKSIYFKPDCTPHDLAGISGGENFGILAKVPILVK